MDITSKLLTLTVLGVGGYFGYTRVVKPALERQRLEALARARAVASGTSYQDALSQLAAATCQAAVAAKSGGAASGNPLTNAGCKLLGTVVGKTGAAAAKYAANNPERALALALSAPVSAPIILAEKIPILGTGVKAVESGTKKVLNKLKFWGLEGLSC